MKKITALLLTLVMLIPAVCMAESLPFGLKLGMNPDETIAALEADTTLGKLTYNMEDLGDSISYTYTDVDVLGTGVTAASVEVDVDSNNSAGDMRLTGVSYVINPQSDPIGMFRKLLTALKADYGDPDEDPFLDVDTYIEWGTLYASWITDDTRVSLTLSRMYGSSVMLSFSSRKNYDPADLAE